MHRLLGEALTFLDAHREAATAFRAALSLDPRDVWLRWRLGLALLEEGCVAEAMEHLVPALASGGLPADSLQQTGIVFYNQGLTQQARDFFDLAVSLDPENVTAAWYRMTSLLPQVAASEEEVDRQRAAYAAALGALEHYCAIHPNALRRLADTPLPLPFYLPYQGRDDRALQERLGSLVAKIMAHHPAVPAPHACPGRRYGKRLRRRYRQRVFSSALQLENPDQGMAGGFGSLALRTDRLLYRCSDRRADGTGARTLRHFRPRPPARRGMGEPDCRRPSGFAAVPGNRHGPDDGPTGRLAPGAGTMHVVGHPETSGFPSIDYFLSSDLMEIPDAEAFYSEKLIRLPNLSIAYKPDHLADIDVVSRAELGLAETDTVYWCCQNLSKYLPRHDDVFARIAKQHAAARFLFLDDPAKREGNRIFRERLTTAFSRHGLDWQRHCVFLPRLAQRRFLGVTRITDIFLDSIGWSGCNSVFDALALGVPVVTLPGQLMRSRHAAAILTRLGIDETIAKDENDFVFLAVQLGRDKITRRALRRRIESAQDMIFDDPAPVRALADFFEEAVAAAGEDQDLNAA